MTAGSCWLALLAALLFAAGHARADLWTGRINNDWFLSNNWEFIQGPPGANEDAVFPEAGDFGLPVIRTDIQISSSTTVRNLVVQTPLNAQYTFTGSNGAVLTVTGAVNFANTDLQALNVHTLSRLGLISPNIAIFNNAVLSLNDSIVTTDLIGTASGRVDINSGSTVQTRFYLIDDPAGEFRVNSGGELEVIRDTTLVRGTTTINSGGQLNAVTGVDLEYNGTALLQFFTGHAVDNGVHLKATGGGDITSTSFIDVGNGNTSTLTVTGAGSTLTSGGSTSDWGLGASGNATVTISDSAVATVNEIQAGTGGARFAGTISGGGTLRTTRTLSSFTMGGGSAVRQVSLDVDGGTFEVDGTATFNNMADLNLISGTVNFDGGATFNAGSRLDWSGGNVNLGAGRTLLVDGGAVNRTRTAGFSFSGNTTTRLRNEGIFVTPSFFDLGNATLDVNNSTLTVGTAGGTVSDWGAGAATTATLSNNAVATYNSGLRMSFGGGTTNATVSSGARLVASFLSAGGDAASNVMLNVNGGAIEAATNFGVFRGATATASAGGRIKAENIVLGSPAGIASLAVTGDGSMLDANDTLFAGREGTSTLTISDGANAEASTGTVIGQNAGANSTVNVTGSGSTLVAGSALIVGETGAGTLNVDFSGLVNVFGGVTVNGASKINLDASGAMELSPGSSIQSEGEIELSGNSELRGDIVSFGQLRIRDSSVTRGVTLHEASQTFVNNASVGSLVQEAGAELHFGLFGTNSFDDLSVTGAATLGGDLVVSLGGGFSPAVGDQFQILSAGSISGTFATEDFSAAPLAGGLEWDVLTGLTSVTLKVVEAGLGSDIRGVRLFYNNSGFDRNGAAVTDADFAAIATDKNPLSAGDTGGFGNISGFSRGINGIFIDIDDLPADGRDINAEDFVFTLGNDNLPESWVPAPEPTSIGVLANQGADGADRVFVTFADGAISDTWLRVNMRATGSTGLTQEEDFFFGAAAGETGAGFVPTIVGVDAADLQSIGRNLSPLAERGTELVIEPNDINRDGTIDAFDLQVVARNLSPNVIRLITPQLGGMGGATGVPEPAAWVIVALLGVVAWLAGGNAFLRPKCDPARGAAAPVRLDESRR